MLTAIRNALTASVEKATQEGADGGALRHFVDEESAAGLLEEHSTISGDAFSKDLAPSHKWLQAIYLTDAGTLPIDPDRLARVLDVPRATASAMLQALASARPS